MVIDNAGNVGIGATGPERLLSVIGGSMHLRQQFTVSSSADVDGPLGTGMLIIVRDSTYGGTALVLYENSLTPTIISQVSGGTTTFVTAAPGATEIQIKNRTGSIGVAFRAGSSRNNAVVYVAAIIADTD